MKDQPNPNGPIKPRVINRSMVNKSFTKFPVHGRKPRQSIEKLDCGTKAAKMPARASTIVSIARKATHAVACDGCHRMVDEEGVQRHGVSLCKGCADTDDQELEIDDARDSADFARTFQTY
jgi:hypothetical protein